MSAKLLYSSPLWFIANGIRYSHGNHHLSDSKFLKLDIEDWNKTIDATKEDFIQQVVPTTCILGDKDFDLIKRVGFKMKHESVLEHSLIIYEIESSRALLQQLSRHRIGISATVMSTRYTLTKGTNGDNLNSLKNEKPFHLDSDFNCQNTEVGKRASKYLYFTGNDRTDYNSILALENLRQDLVSGVSNDIAKYALPEAFKFKGQYSFNLRSLIHLLELRTSKDALQEFQQLCVDMIDALPSDYRELILTNEKIKNNYKRIKNKK